MQLLLVHEDTIRTKVQPLTAPADNPLTTFS
jgi:hypothetical protein